MNIFKVYPSYDLEPVQGEGIYIFDREGQKYLDLYGGHAVISVGHNHPDYRAALKKQIDQLIFYSNSVKNKLQNELAKKLGRLSGYEYYQLFLTNSGAEANENALKLASFYNERTKVLAFKKSFHGRTSGAVAVTDNSAIQAPFNKKHEVIFTVLGDLEALYQVFSENEICAVIVEGIQGVGGIVVPEQNFLKELKLICERYNSVLILDEVQSGYGRTGKFFAHQHSDIQPDMITVAKSMGNGLPIGGVLISPKFKPSFGLLGSTFGGNHLACTAAIAVLDIIAGERLMENATKTGNYLIEKLKVMPFIKEVRGTGLMLGIDMGFPTTQLRKNLLKDMHIFTGGSSDKNVIRLLPPLVMTTEHADIFIDSFEKMLTSTAV